MKKISSTYCFLVLFLLLSALSLQPLQAAEESLGQKEQTYQSLELFSNILSLLQENYVEKLDTDKAIKGAINGMLLSLDPHSSYLTAEDFDDLQEETRGKFTGIGIEVTIKDNKLTVIAPIEGTPAYNAGILANDIIAEINGQPADEMMPVEAIKNLRGPKGSQITLTIMRKDEPDLKEFTLVRDTIPLHSVRACMLDPLIAYTRITNFQQGTTEDYIEAIEKLKHRKTLKGIILDLRNNPGGLLEQAVSVSDLFLDSGLIVYTKGRTEEQNMVFNAEATTTRFTMPLLLLVNDGTASAAEIVAGAVQDHKRGLILGTKTFGKGSVQTVIPLPDGDGIRLTTARYYTPSGRSIQARGIQPDIELPRSEPSQGYVSSDQTATIQREKDLLNHIENDSAQAPQINKSTTTSEKAAELFQKDSQLRIAYDILRGTVFLTPETNTNTREQPDMNTP